ncbi:hypothetical protein Pd630_LPD06010 [Rhodococcus opacus PD630]|nr:hypothetical protein Pd630_LPD06010 [Rhodococcus opacus PD630]
MDGAFPRAQCAAGRGSTRRPGARLARDAGAGRAPPAAPARRRECRGAPASLGESGADPGRGDRAAHGMAGPSRLGFRPGDAHGTVGSADPRPRHRIGGERPAGVADRRGARGLGTGGQRRAVGRATPARGTSAEPVAGGGRSARTPRRRVPGEPGDRAGGGLAVAAGRRDRDRSRRGGSRRRQAGRGVGRRGRRVLAHRRIAAGEQADVADSGRPAQRTFLHGVRGDHDPHRHGGGDRHRGGRRNRSGTRGRAHPGECIARRSAGAAQKPHRPGAARQRGRWRFGHRRRVPARHRTAAGGHEWCRGRGGGGSRGSAARRDPGAAGRRTPTDEVGRAGAGAAFRRGARPRRRGVLRQDGHPEREPPAGRHRRPGAGVRSRGRAGVRGPERRDPRPAVRPHTPPTSRSPTRQWTCYRRRTTRAAIFRSAPDGPTPPRCRGHTCR